MLNGNGSKFAGLTLHSDDKIIIILKSSGSQKVWADKFGSDNHIMDLQLPCQYEEFFQSSTVYHVPFLV